MATKYVNVQVDAQMSVASGTKHVSVQVDAQMSVASGN